MIIIDERRNSEGYMDLTAYKAMQNVGGIKMEWVKGDIVKWERANGTMSQAVLISCHDGFSSILELQDEEPSENGHKIKVSGEVKHVDCGKIVMLWHNRIRALIESMGVEPFKKLQDHVGKCLGTDITTEPIVKEVEVPVEVVKEVEKIVERDTPDTIIKIAKLEAERDTFKALYMELVQQRAV